MKKGNILMKFGASALLCAVLGGCSLSQITDAPPEPNITKGFEAECTVTAYIIPPGESTDSEEEFVFGGSIKRLGGGFWEMSVTSPETVAGMEISMSDDTMTSHLGQLSLDMTAADIPDASPVTAVFTAIDSAAALYEAGTALEKGDDGGWTLRDGGCTIVFDGEGNPVSMAVSTPRISVSFTSFAVLSENMGTSDNKSHSSEQTSQTTADTTTVTTTASVTDTTVDTTTVTAVTTSAITTAESSHTVTEIVTTVPSAPQLHTESITTIPSETVTME